MKYLWLTVIFVSTLSYGAVTVTENTNRRLTFVFELQDLSVQEYLRNDVAVSRIGFKDQNCDLVQPEGFLLPGQSVLFGVPQQGSAKVRFVSLQTRRITLAAPPSAKSSNSAAMEQLQPSFSNPWASQIVYAHYSGYRTGQLYIRPLRYDARTRSLTILKKGSCTIEFPQTAQQRTSGIASNTHYSQMLKTMLLNFGVAQYWRKPRKKGMAKSAAARSFHSASRMLMFAVGDGHSGFNEGLTDENGIAKITGSAASMFIGEKIANLALYASPKLALDHIVPAPDSIPGSVAEIPLLRFDNDNDGIFDADDYVFAYVSGTSDWVYKRDSSLFNFTLHPYDDYRHYWLASVAGGAKQMASYTSPAVPASPLTTFEDHIMYRRVLELSNREGTSCEQSGTSWIWRSLTKSSTGFDHIISRTNGAGGVLDSMRIATNLRSSSGMLTLTLGGQQLCSSCDAGNWTALPAGVEDTLHVELTMPESRSYFEVTSIEVKYQRRIDMTGISSLRIFSSSQPGLTGYQVANLPSETCYLFRIDADETATSLIATIPSQSTAYSWADSSAGMQYFICAESAVQTGYALTPWYKRSASTYEIKDLRSTANAADYLIVTDTILATEALRLAAHKASSGLFSTPRVVLVSDIYREFSGGNTDPTALRNFLLYASTHWSGSTAFHVLLLGNGHYDYKGYVSTEEVHVPTAQFGEYCIDEYFVYLDSSEDASSLTPAPAPDMYIGRLPCNTVGDAEVMVDKIVELEGSSSDRGPWRNRVLLVADDDMQGSDRDPISTSNPHHHSSEDVEQRVLENQQSVEIRKVYLFEYEWNEVYLKPEAARALINEINNGVSFVNYFGHGSDDRWADEGLFSLESMSSLANKQRYPLISSFSCSVGRFDRPGNDCLSDLFMKAISAGASISIASTRKAYASDNEKLAESLYSALFENKGANTAGQAYMMAKGANRNKNQKAYALFGDPSLRLLTVTDSVSLSLFDKNGVPTDTLMALEEGVVVKGLVKRGAAHNTAFGSTASAATVQIGLYNPQQDSAKRKDGGSGDVTYRLPGAPVFIGKTQFSSGAFEQSIFLPRNLFFDKPGVRLVAYAWDNTGIAKGLKNDIIFSGTDTTRPSDTLGPSIAIRSVYGNQDFNSGGGFTDHITGMLPLECEINIYDESGIDVIGAGPDEGLTLEVPGSLIRQNINHKFLFNEGDFRRGAATVTFEEGDLEEGTHTVQVTAQDLLGNIAKLSAQVEVVGFDEFELGQVFNYPNPFRMGTSTKFYYHQSNTYANDPNRAWYGTVRASIRIYTLSGKLVRVIKNATNGQVWDGTDTWGNKLAPNVYLYRVIVDVEMPEVNRTEKSTIRKLVIRPPR